MVNDLNKIHDNPLEVVRCVNILGLTVSNDLKWNERKKKAEDCIV